jgi:hypothetical protein
MSVPGIVLLGLVALSTLSYGQAESTNITVYGKCYACFYISYRRELGDILLLATASYVKCRAVGVDNEEIQSIYMGHFTINEKRTELCIVA